MLNTIYCYFKDYWRKPFYTILKHFKDVVTWQQNEVFLVFRCYNHKFTVFEVTVPTPTKVRHIKDYDMNFISTNEFIYQLSLKTHHLHNVVVLLNIDDE